MSAIGHSFEFEMAVARSQFLDAYNGADAALRRRMAEHGLVVNNQMGQNIKLLQEVAPSPTYSKEIKKRVDTLLTYLVAIQPIRCDIVHGLAEVYSKGSEHFQFFANVQQQPTDSAVGRMLSLDNIRHYTDLLAKIAVGLSAR